VITFYTAPTPNCYKVSIALEELGLPYEVIRLDLKALDQKQLDFLAINPNGRVPSRAERSCGGSRKRPGGCCPTARTPAPRPCNG
jgi:GSH-dependent disulfide-bond oxidoreductase